MRIQIQRILCFALLLNVLAGGGLLAGLAPAMAADAYEGQTTLLEKDFSNALEGQSAAQLGFDYSTLPSGATSSAVVEREPVTNQKALHLSVNGAGTSPFLISKTFNESKKGTITAEITFMQPGTSKKTNQIIQLYNSASGTSSKYLVIGGVDSSKGTVYWTDTAPQNLNIPYTLNQWHTIKIEVNTLAKRFSMWLDGVEIRARERANLYSSTDPNAFDFKKIVIGTPAGTGELYVRNVKVSHVPPNYKPAAPEIAYWVGRDQSIAMWVKPDTWATKYAIKIKAREEDPWYTTATYTGTPQTIPILASPSASNEWDYVQNKAVKITNGKKYIVGVAAITRDEIAKIDYEGEITQFEATPYAVTPIETPVTNVIGTVTAYNNYQAHKWSINSGLKVGDEPFTDRTSVLKIMALPDKYKTTEWIKTHADTMKYPISFSNPFPQIATFPVRDKAEVYVAMDQRETPPSWLTTDSGWTDTGDTIQLADTALSYTFKIYKREFAANELVTMGLNNYNDYNTGKNAGYFVMTQRIPTQLETDSIREWVNSPNYTVTGSVYENADINSVTLSVYQNKSLIFNNKLTQNNFNVDLNLTPGANLIELFAMRSGSTLSDKITATINYDMISPEIHISEPPSTVIDSVYTLQGSLSESANLTIKLNGAMIADSVAKAVYEPFSYPLTLAEGNNTIEVSAVDIAGNVKIANYSINYEFWAGQAAIYDLEGNQINALAASKDVLAQRQVTNTTSSMKQVTLWFVLHDVNNSMIDYSSVIADFEPGETKTLSTGFLLPAQVTGYYVKAFIWDSLSGMKPYSDKIQLQ
ncbi:MAG: Pectinesterase [Paenibacillus sp.]|nr:Pectinesterase [Paenibacillus sp.]